MKGNPPQVFQGPLKFYLSSPPQGGVEHQLSPPQTQQNHLYWCFVSDIFKFLLSIFVEKMREFDQVCSK